MRRALFPALGLTLGLGLVLAASAVPAADKDKDAPAVPPREGKSETIQLFDGKTLDGWEGDKNLWSVENGEIVGKSPGSLAASTYLLTKKPFTDFRLLVTGKLVLSEVHSGVCFWGKPAPEKGDEFPKAPEKAIPFTYGGHLVMFPSGWGMWDLYRREGGLGVDAGPGKKAGEGKQHDWNQLEILAQGNRIRVAANGMAIIDWRDPKPDLIHEAPIGLQLHSNKDAEEVRFKDITVTTFPPEDKLLTVKEK
jgi:3-keto-disaccharide hydrolase